MMKTDRDTGSKDTLVSLEQSKGFERQLEKRKPSTL